MTSPQRSERPSCAAPADSGRAPARRRPILSAVHRARAIGTTATHSLLAPADRAACNQAGSPQAFRCQFLYCLPAASYARFL